MEAIQSTDVRDIKSRRTRNVTIDKPARTPHITAGTFLSHNKKINNVGGPKLTR
ncbi:hypothetical protein APP_36540 [Aeribacillus pallidus]|nr:hypothetical protein APP_36540 [Aeribacillus pallidus]